MSYTASNKLSIDQMRALLAVAPETISSLSPETRLDLALRYGELQARRREAFWNALQAFATAAIPLAAFLGITSLFRGEK